MVESGQPSGQLTVGLLLEIKSNRQVKFSFKKDRGLVTGLYTITGCSILAYPHRPLSETFSVTNLDTLDKD